MTTKRESMYIIKVLGKEKTEISKTIIRKLKARLKKDAK